MQKRPGSVRYASRSDDEIDYPPEKICSKCRTIKPAADFPKARREKDGLKSYCKECGKVGRAAWYHANAEREKAKATAYQAANPEKAREWNKKAWDKGRAKFNAQKLARHHERRDEIAAARRQRYATDAEFRAGLLAGQALAYRRNPAPMQQRSKAFREANRETCRVWANNYRARRVTAEGECTPEEWAAILAYFEHRCAYCLQPPPEGQVLAVEHMMPLSRGGTNHPDNLVPACKSCNSSKRNRTPIEFLAATSALECRAA